MTLFVADMTSASEGTFDMRIGTVSLVVANLAAVVAFVSETTATLRLFRTVASEVVCGMTTIMKSVDEELSSKQSTYMRQPSPPAVPSPEPLPASPLVTSTPPPQASPAPDAPVSACQVSPPPANMSALGIAKIRWGTYRCCQCPSSCLQLVGVGLVEKVFVAEFRLTARKVAEHTKR